MNNLSTLTKINCMNDKLRIYVSKTVQTWGHSHSTGCIVCIFISTYLTSTSAYLLVPRLSKKLNDVEYFQQGVQYTMSLLIWSKEYNCVEISSYSAGTYQCVASYNKFCKQMTPPTINFVHNHAINGVQRSSGYHVRRAFKWEFVLDTVKCRFMLDITESMVVLSM